MTTNTKSPGPKRAFTALTISAAAFFSFASIAPAAPAKQPLPAEVVNALKELKAYQSNDATVKNHLEKFDTLDFEVYSNQQWDRIKESHTLDVLVHYPDGHTSKGLEAHIAEMKPQFMFAPDTHIIAHPVKIGNGEWTAVIGEAKGTFTKPMPIGGDNFIQPTNKAFDFQMVTIGHWNKDGLMDEEWIFLDFASLKKQIGLG